MSLREKLKVRVQPLHARLEQHSRMIRYAAGTAAADEWPATLLRLASFWYRGQPANRTLPPRYDQFLERWRTALAEDIAAALARGGTGPSECVSYSTRSDRKGARARDLSPISYDEMAWHYVLLGSGLGARHMLRKVPSAPVPRHLQLLAEATGSLWRDFTCIHLAAVPLERHEVVCDDAACMFQTLYEFIDSAYVEVPTPSSYVLLSYGSLQ